MREVERWRGEHTYIVGSCVNVTQSRGVCVSNAGHVQFQNVPESRPEDTTDISRIPARKTVCVCLFVYVFVCLFVVCDLLL